METKADFKFTLDLSRRILPEHDGYGNTSARFGGCRGLSCYSICDRLCFLTCSPEAQGSSPNWDHLRPVDRHKLHRDSVRTTSETWLRHHRALTPFSAANLAELAPTPLAAGHRAGIPWMEAARDRSRFTLLQRPTPTIGCLPSRGS